MNEAANSELPLSVVRLPVQIHKAELERDINGQLGQVLYEDDDVDGNGLAIRAEKVEDIEIRLEPDAIYYRVPVKLWVEKSIRITTLEAEGDLSLNFRTQLSILENWDLDTNTELVDYEWLKKPVLKLGRIDLPIQFIANRLLERSKSVVTDAIDHQVRENLDLEGQVGRVWTMLHQPFLLSDEFKSWMILQPKQLFMTPLVMEKESIRSTVILESSPQVTLGGEPAPTDSTTLPTFSWEDSPHKLTTVFLQADIPFAEAERMARKNMIGQTFEQGNRTVSIENIRLFGRGNKLVVQTQLVGSYEGHLNLEGKPQYNASKRKFELNQLELELKTRNILHKSVGWLFKGSFKRQIRESVDEYLNIELEQLKTTIQQEFENMPIAPGVTMNGELHDLNVRDVFITTDAIRVWLGLQGNLQVDVRGLSD